MVVELLTFRIDPTVRARWLDADREHWTTFLARQTGFVRKEVWWSRDEPDLVRVVVWWASRADWDAVPAVGLAEVVTSMGELEHRAVCEAYDVVAAG